MPYEDILKNMCQPIFSHNSRAYVDFKLSKCHAFPIYVTALLLLHDVTTKMFEATHDPGNVT